MRYGYARVSTAGQDLEVQLQALKSESCDKIYSEKFTGIKADRPELNKVLQLLKEGDTLVVTKLDQFIKTHDNKRVYIKVQKSNGFWWSTKTTKSVTSTSQISFNVNAGTGDYRIVVYDAPESTGYDKPPLYYAKSTKYSGSVTGL